ncbi:MAG: hypothetical protein ACKORL_01385, partial [Phycisphaerales bacterium]
MVGLVVVRHADLQALHGSAAQRQSQRCRPAAVVAAAHLGTAAAIERGTRRERLPVEGLVEQLTRGVARLDGDRHGVGDRVAAARGVGHLPRRRTREVGVGHVHLGDEASAMPVLAWDYSPYDTREANPTVRLWVEGDALVAEVDVPDAHLTGAPAWEVPDAARRRDPIADAVSVTIESRDPAGQLLDEAFHWEPFTPGAALDGG